MSLADKMAKKKRFKHKTLQTSVEWYEANAAAVGAEFISPDGTIWDRWTGLLTGERLDDMIVDLLVAGT